MKQEIIIDNVLKYVGKESGKPGTRISFRFTNKESFSNTEKFKGRPVVDLFYSGHEVFDKIPTELIDKKIMATFKEVNSNNSLRYSRTIESIQDGLNVIRIL